MATAISANDINAAPVNRAAIQTATGRVELPPGIVSVDAAPVLTRANNALTLSGNGTTIRSQQLYGDYFGRAALNVRCGLNGIAALSFRGGETVRGVPLPSGQIGWSFPGGDSRTEFFRPTRIYPGQTIPTGGEFMRAFHGVPFAKRDGVTWDVGSSHGIALHDDVFATDGPPINECVGEFRRVVAVTPNTVTLDSPLQRAYQQGTFVVGPFPGRLAFSGITFDGQLGSVLIQQSCDVQFADCEIRTPVGAGPSAAGWLGLYGCGRVGLRRCKLPGVQMSSGHDVTIEDCVSGPIIGEQGQIRTTIKRTRATIIDAAPTCTGWDVYDCTATERLGIYNGWTVDTVQVFGPVYIRGRCFVDDVTTNGKVHVQSGRDIVIDGLDCNYVKIDANTSGQISNCTAPVICPDAATAGRWVVNGRVLA